jgi:hypothetical protein
MMAQWSVKGAVSEFKLIPKYKHPGCEFDVLTSHKYLNTKGNSFLLNHAHQLVRSCSVLNAATAKLLIDNISLYFVMTRMSWIPKSGLEFYKGHSYNAVSLTCSVLS